MPFDPTGMDEAAGQAERELSTIDQAAVEVMRNWFRKWYAKAGYKRLGKILVGRATYGGNNTSGGKPPKDQELD